MGWVIPSFSARPIRSALSAGTGAASTGGISKRAVLPVTTLLRATASVRRAGLGTTHLLVSGFARSVVAARERQEMTIAQVRKEIVGQQVSGGAASPAVGRRWR